jgi:hypothetical protein
MSSDGEEEVAGEERRMVAIIVKPCEGVDPEALYKVRRLLLGCSKQAS